MRKRIIFILLLLLFSLNFTSSVLADVDVKGYYRSDGTYVKPHKRSNPDGNLSNNWSTEGNENPYTGEKGTREIHNDGEGDYTTRGLPNGDFLWIVVLIFFGLPFFIPSKNKKK